MRLGHEDDRVVLGQLGRSPRGPWTVAIRCAFGRPTVVQTSPRLEDGGPFPTLLWLTCPWLCDTVAGLESAGAAARWRERLAWDRAAADRMRAADEAYRERRADVAGGADPCAPTGIAGQRDPLATKCLHAHAAAALAGIDDPVGAFVLASAPPQCPDDRCATLLESRA